MGLSLGTGWFEMARLEVAGANRLIEFEERVARGFGEREPLRIRLNLRVFDELLVYRLHEKRAHVQHFVPSVAVVLGHGKIRERAGRPGGGVYSTGKLSESHAVGKPYLA